MIGAKIKRIDGPSKDSLVLTLERLVITDDGRTRERRFVRLTLNRPRAEEVPSRPKGATPDGFTQKLRKELGGGRVAGAEQCDHGVILTVKRGEVVRRLVMDTSRKNAVLVDGDGAFIHARFGGPLRALKIRAGSPYPFPGPFEELALEVGTPKTPEDLATRERQLLQRAIRRSRKKQRRTLSKIEHDISRAEQAPALRALAQRVLNALPGRDPKIEIPPSRTPQEYAERLFHRAKRYERGTSRATTRKEEVIGQLEELDDLLATLKTAADNELETIRRQALLAGVRDVQQVAKKKHTRARSPFRRFLIAGGRTALVGRSARDNDTLTLRHARPHDLWLHARGVPGSHVIVPLERGQECGSDALADAAVLAAHFSSASRDDSVEVQYVARRHVHKRKGSAPGSVRVQREKTILVLLRRDDIARLVGGEIDPEGRLR